MNEYFCFASIIITEEYDYFTDFVFNGLFCINKKNQVMEFISFLVGNDKWDSELIRKLLLIDGSIIAFPYKGRGIYEYSIESKKMCRIYNKDLWGDGFSNVLKVKGGFLLVPLNIRDKFIILKDDKTICGVDSINKLVTDAIRNEDKLYLEGYGSCISKDSLYMVLQQSDYIIKIDLNEPGIEKIEIKGASFRNLLLINDYIWLTSSKNNKNDSCVIRYDTVTGTVRWYSLPEIGSEHSCYGFTTFKDTLLAFENEGDHIWIYDETADEWGVFARLEDYPVGFRRVREYYPLFFGFHHMYGKLLLLTTGGNGTIEIDESTGNMSFYESRIPEDIMEMRLQIEKDRKINLMKRLFHDNKNEVIIETDEMDMDTYMGFVTRSDYAIQDDTSLI